MFEQSGRLRDAVAIHLHKRHDKQAAARCYERANMLAQAADLYEETKAWETAGDLHDQLGNKQRAQDLWKTAADQTHDVLVKGRIWSEKLASPALALEILDQAWPKGDRSGLIVEEMCRLLAQHDSGDAAIDLANRVLDAPASIQGFTMVKRVKLLLKIIKGWRDERLTSEVFDRVWTLTATEIAEDTKAGKQLINILPELAVNDKILARDVSRYTIPKKTFQVQKQSTLQGCLSPNQVVRVCESGRWYSLQRYHRGVAFAGRNYDAPYEFAVGYWNEVDGVSFHTTADPKGETDTVFTHLVLGLANDALQVIAYIGDRLVTTRVGKQTVDLLGSGNILGAGCDYASGRLYTLSYKLTGSLCIGAYDKEGFLQKETPIDLVTEEVKDLRWRMTATERYVAIATRGIFACVKEGGEILSMAINGSPFDIQASPRSGNEFLLVAGNEVIYVTVENDKSLGTVNLYTDYTGRSTPVVNFLSDGSIVIVWRGGGEVYAPNKFLKPRATLELPEDLGTPVGLQPCGPNQFAVMVNIGNLVVFRY